MPGAYHWAGVLYDGDNLGALEAGLPGRVDAHQLVDVGDSPAVPHVRRDRTIALHHDAPLVCRARGDVIVARGEGCPAVWHITVLGFHALLEVKAGFACKSRSSG